MANPLTDHVAETYRSLIAYGAQVTNALLLLNGGALIAIGAYLRGEESGIVDVLRCPSGIVVIGLVFAVLAMAGAYATQLIRFNDLQKGPGPSAWQRGVLYGTFCFVSLSLTAFLIGLLWIVAVLGPGASEGSANHQPARTGGAETLESAAAPGWVLMLPPYVGTGVEGRADTSGPVHAWKVARAFDLADQCERHRLAAIDDASGRMVQHYNRPEGIGPDSELLLRLHGEHEHGRCVPTELVYQRPPSMDAGTQH